MAKQLKTPKPDQRLYRYARWNGHAPGMEIVRFIEQGLAGGGATAETWLVQELKVTTGDRLRQVRCSIDSYYRSKRDAYKADLANLRAGKKSISVQRAKLLVEYHETEAEIRRVEAEAAATAVRDARDAKLETRFASELTPPTSDAWLEESKAAKDRGGRK